jgi:hypothetical protein
MSFPVLKADGTLKKAVESVPAIIAKQSKRLSRRPEESAKTRVPNCTFMARMEKFSKRIAMGMTLAHQKDKICKR